MKKPITTFGFLHIGKTAGSALRAALREAATDKFAFRVFSHDSTLESIWQKAPELPLIFFVRNPIDRFVSGFNSRLRAGLPVRNVPWTTEDAVAFMWFPTPNDLAEALASDDPRTISASRFAMSTIGHVRKPLAWHLHSPEFLSRHASKLLYVGVFEDMATSLSGLSQALGLPPGHLQLPTDEVIAYRAPRSLATELSSKARSALESWYAPDLGIYQHCLALHRQYPAV